MLGLPRIEGTVILTFDVSGSMAADDLKPTRMEAAKAAALDFVDSQPTSVRIGVVAFSDGGITVQSPTDKREDRVESSRWCRGAERRLGMGFSSRSTPSLWMRAIRRS